MSQRGSVLKGVQFTGEPSTSGRVLAPGPTLLATHNRGNHGGIAPTKIGEFANLKPETLILP
ncbi:hypothetical protein [Prochlorothrix hollandica]|uniref:hypothetical protein n=1 Tax=Prochlorothrix hollandica TaxID=1223 RepID=UPI0011D1C50E|nr:hypothetical protein [Prochlorothrix hollandica]